jgi:hypothetical protein
MRFLELVMKVGVTLSRTHVFRFFHIGSSFGVLLFKEIHYFFGLALGYSAIPDQFS